MKQQQANSSANDQGETMSFQPDELQIQANPATFTARWGTRGMCALLLATLCWNPPVQGQAPSPNAPNAPIAQRMRTELQFDIVFPPERQNGAAAQEWTEIFANLNVPLRIRQPAYNDEPGVSQQVFGTIRRVKATGQLDRNGTIIFPDRKFSRSDVGALSEWVEELQTYGAQGAPEGQPIWGMKQVEFDQLLAQMVHPVEQPTAGLSLTEAIRALELPQAYPLRFSAATRELLVAQGELPVVAHDLRQFAKGTALAMLLRDYGLAFSPRRMPDESVVLSIDPFDEKQKFWPIGWDPDSLGHKRLQLAEKMYIAQPIGIEQTPLKEVLVQLETETGLRVFIDPLAVSSLNLKLDRLVVNFPRKRTSWSLCLRTILSQLKLTHEVRVDENSRPFVWLTRFTPRQAAPGAR